MRVYANFKVFDADRNASKMIDRIHVEINIKREPLQILFRNYHSRRYFILSVYIFTDVSFTAPC